MADNVRQYIFISTISVFAAFKTIGLDENSPVDKLDDETVEEITGLTYGPMDRSDRFTYWPVRVAKGGEVLAPGKPETPTQLIDVRDLAEWIVRMAEGNVVGTFNATSPAEELTIGEMLESCKQVSGSDAAFTWVNGAFLAEKEIQAWSDMPVWVPLDGDYAGHPFINVNCALRRGLTFRPINETVRATLKWWNNEPKQRQENK